VSAEITIHPHHFTTHSGNYQQLVERSEKVDFVAIRQNLQPIPVLRLLHAVIGMMTELGEIADVLKRYIFYSADLDIPHLREELGDHLWYVATATTAIGHTLDLVMDQNIEKLRIRYPERYSNLEAMLRDVNKEQEVFRGRNQHDSKDQKSHEGA
jgi:NTP pyrophosphatase (non-canonical NTP hydrolase)